MIDPIHSLAFAFHSNRGIYTLLLRKKNACMMFSLPPVMYCYLNSSLAN